MNLCLLSTRDGTGKSFGGVHFLAAQVCRKGVSEPDRPSLYFPFVLLNDAALEPLLGALFGLGGGPAKPVVQCIALIAYRVGL